MRGRGQNYMMRSEKRPGYPNFMSPQKPRRSIWYQVLTIVMLVILCPVGLILMWRKRLKWHGLIKFLLTLISLSLMFLLIGAALWYPFENEKIRNVQNTVSALIDEATDKCIDFFDDMGENLRIVMDNGAQIGAAAGDYVLGQFLEVIASPTPKPTLVPPLTLTQGESDRNGIASLMNRPTPSPSPTPSPTPTASPTPTPTATVVVSANTLTRPTPSSEPGKSPTPVPPVTATPTPSPTPVPTATPIPTATPTPTPVPTVNPALIPPLEDIGEFLVWHTSNGKWYHKGSTCGSMSNARQHSISSAVAKNLTACPYCHPLDTKWGKTDEPVVYVSTDKFWHTRTGCESNTKEWTPMLLEEARTDGTLQPCDACGAYYYKDGVPESIKNPNATQMPTVTQAPQIQPQTTEIIQDGLNLSQVINGDTLVYYSGNTSHYHRRNRCASATTTTFLPHTLMDALLEGKISCPVCNPPAPITE